LKLRLGNEEDNFRRKSANLIFSRHIEWAHVL